ncbi:ABC transporter permease [Mucilaginibacter sabulilitoris]|uniref:ABC transporter permease n=1 Tax=Mucilaginibacter sabulilitoris TaxID=1173583 RepID=A0ABZ0TKL6_9SPHI|nr:ABC transporter permease [Mucilaginibacter sabulilitoris]WPU93598.1 ABC transporter permease [Mucilaginibacter sabulilitoris]
MLQKLFENRLYAFAVVLVVIIAAASAVFSSTFPTFNNFSQILLNLSTDTIVAVGMMLLLISGTFDLSVGSTVAFVGCFTSYLMFFFHVPVPLAILLGMLCASVIGLVNGYLIAYQGINPMIQTLAMMGIIRGGALMVSGSGIQGLPYWFNVIGQSKLLGIQMPVWYMLLTVGVFSFLLNKTIFFRRYYYIGNNEKAADLSGIRVKRMKMYGFILSSLLAGAAGILLTSRLGAALPTMGRGLELKVITAVILGGASLSGGIGKMPGALLGALFMGVIGNIMVISRVSGYWQDIILGLILIAILWLDKFLQKKYEV